MWRFLLHCKWRWERGKPGSTWTLAHLLSHSSDSTNNLTSRFTKRIEANGAQLLHLLIPSPPTLPHVKSCPLPFHPFNGWIIHAYLKAHASVCALDPVLHFCQLKDSIILASPSTLSISPWWIIPVGICKYSILSSMLSHTLWQMSLGWQFLIRYHLDVKTKCGVSHLFVCYTPLLPLLGFFKKYLCFFLFCLQRNAYSLYILGKHRKKYEENKSSF